MAISKKRLEEILAFKDEDISDIPELTPEECARMRYARLDHPEWFKPVKKKICMYIDADILDWYKTEGKGYQTRINHVLRRDMLRESVRAYGNKENSEKSED